MDADNTLHNTFRTATYTQRHQDGWLFDLGDGETALVPNDDFTDEPTFVAGDKRDLLVERPYAGFWAASISKVEKLKLWDEFERLAETGGIIEGTIVGSNKGGLSVDVGLRAFLPMSQIDVHRVDDPSAYIGRTDKFKVTEFDKKRANLVVSRRALLEAERDGNRDELLASLEAGQKFEGTVRNVLDYGAFVDIGGVEGLLHASNLSWGRVDHPSELLKPGDKLEVMVLDWDPKRERLGLGRKQLLKDPWAEVAEQYEEGQKTTGKVVSIVDFGAFVSIAPGLDGLVHITELSWTKHIEKASEILSVGDEVDVQVVSIDGDNRRLGLSIKRLEKNPWDMVAAEMNAGDIVNAEIKSIVDFGLFVELRPGVDGLIHVSDLSWTEKIEDPADHYEVGQSVEAKVLEIDAEAGRASLGIKQLSNDPWSDAAEVAKVGERIDVTITRLTDFGAFAQIVEGVEGLIHISELSEGRVERPAEVVKPGQTHKALVMSFDRANARISLSLKREELDGGEVKSYTDEGSATALGDVLRQQLAQSEDDS